MGEWKNYFVYTRKERLAIISLILITLALLAIQRKIWRLR